MAFEPVETSFFPPGGGFNKSGSGLVYKPFVKWTWDILRWCLEDLERDADITAQSIIYLCSAMDRR